MGSMGTKLKALWWKRIVRSLIIFGSFKVFWHLLVGFQQQIYLGNFRKTWSFHKIKQVFDWITSPMCVFLQSFFVRRVWRYKNVIGQFQFTSNYSVLSFPPPFPPDSPLRLSVRPIHSSSPLNLPNTPPPTRTHWGSAHLITAATTAAMLDYSSSPRCISCPSCSRLSLSW